MNLITSRPEILDGTPVFDGTRVPVSTLIEYIKGGERLNDFLTDFPTVSKEQVVEFLETAKNRLATSA
jgi:uncharacterized protein (DUF433 family)